VQGRTYLLSKS